MSILTFTPNVQVEIALKFPDGKPVEGRFGDQMMYSLAKPADHVVYLDNDVAAKLNILEPRKGEPILACKRWTGKKTDKPQWDFWRPDGSQVKREPQMPGASVSAPAPVPAFSQSNNNGNGSSNGYSNGNGHAANPALQIPPSKIPMDVAILEAVVMVQAAMKASGEQWSDASRQGLVSTIIIQAGKEGWLCCWERGAK